MISIRESKWLSSNKQSGKRQNRISFFSFLPSLPTLFFQTSSFEDTRFIAPDSSGITCQHFVTREENQPPTPIQNIPGKACDWPLAGPHAHCGYHDFGTYQKQFGDREVDFPKRKQGQHIRQTKRAASPSDTTRPK